MEYFHVAFAMPVNTTETSSRLSLEELGKCCDLLAREPQIFTDAISDCTVTSDSGVQISRTLCFTAGPVGKMEQELTLIKNHKFESITLGTNNKVTTTIFHGLTDNPYDLYLSIDYSIYYGETSREGPEGEAFRASYTSRAKQNLVEGVAKMHELKNEGKLVECKLVK
ncbi:hypothetical protein GQ44DRAFT_764244 [Phaeosphaeriaceae sp. PMI808]|nr:hypothetical protein GQ44DRAFT_764244 [Phaeosphaeriaceae sp. PMI808]